MNQVRIVIEANAAPDSEVAIEGVVLSLEDVNCIDTEGADVLKAVADAANTLELDLHLARVKPQVLEALNRDRSFDLTSRTRALENIAAAVGFHTMLHPPAAR